MKKTSDISVDIVDRLFRNYPDRIHRGGGGATARVQCDGSSSIGGRNCCGDSPA
jgi:hypothetical protein